MTVRPLASATVAVVGVGLMGGSLGAALSGKCARRIGTWLPGFEPADFGKSWVDARLVDSCLPCDESLAEADVVVLALPVDAIVSAVGFVAPRMRAGALLTDLGSCKREVVERMDAVGGRIECVGGHPMCGRETPGAGNADPYLFRGARWVLCRTASTTHDGFQLATELVRAAGAESVEVDAPTHDRVVALTSHAPYVMAQALAHAVDARLRENEPSRVPLLAGGGLRDATRLACGDVNMWRAILAANGTELRAALGEVEEQLALLRRLLDSGDGSRVSAWLAAGREGAGGILRAGTRAAR